MGLEIVRSIPPEWKTHFKFIRALAEVDQLIVELEKIYGRKVDPSKLAILDIGGGSDLSVNADLDTSLPGAKEVYGQVAVASGIPYEDYILGYAPWRLRAMWAKGVGSKKRRVNIDIQPQSDRDLELFSCIQMDFLAAMADGTFHSRLKDSGLLPTQGFQVIIMKDIIRDDFPDSSIVFLKSLESLGQRNPDIGNRSIASIYDLIISQLVTVINDSSQKTLYYLDETLSKRMTREG